MLEKISVIDSVNVLEFGQIQIRRVDRVVEDGVELSRQYHRHVLCPGDSLVGEDVRVIAIANAVWTPDVISKYNNLKEQ